MVIRPEGPIDRKKMNTFGYPKSHDLVLRFEQCSRQTIGSAFRLTGLVKLKQIIRVIEVLDLQANPRDSRVSAITSDIMESLENTPELFPLKSKGLLLAASEWNELGDRDRYELTFVNRDIEGVLDGGHNLLAIGTFILGQVLVEDVDRKELKKAKVWGQFKELFNKHLDEVRDYLADDANQDELSTYIPVELLLPKSQDALVLDYFNSALLDIQEARNNNAQLKQETKSHAAGLYDNLKEQFGSDLREKIEWKSNDGGEIKVADLIALTWIPLTALGITVSDENGKEVVPPSPVQTYSSKGECVGKFDRFMGSSSVTSENTGTSKRELRNVPVLSALKLAADLPKLYDLIYELFPGFYNDNDGKFGKIAAVNKLNSKGGVKSTKFSQKAIDWRYPEGFITPLVYGLRSIIAKNEDGTVSWATDPFKFVKEHLPQIAVGYKGVMQENDFDPQKVGKSSLAYEHALNAFELAWLRSNR